MCDHITDTSPCRECTGTLDAATSSGAFVALICDQIERQGRSITDLAVGLGVSRRKMKRVLCGQRSLLLIELETLTDLLHIDRARAMAAIELLGDWRAYEDTTLLVLMRLVPPATRKVNEGADFPLEPLTDLAEDIASNELARLLIANEEQIRRRRNAFVEMTRF